ncbi:hypothetical protein JCM5296_003516 [Sporobolomyces johnsonii]
MRPRLSRLSRLLVAPPNPPQHVTPTAVNSAPGPATAPPARAYGVAAAAPLSGRPAATGTTRAAADDRSRPPSNNFPQLSSGPPRPSGTAGAGLQQEHDRYGPSPVGAEAGTRATWGAVPLPAESSASTSRANEASSGAGGVASSAESMEDSSSSSAAEQLAAGPPRPFRFPPAEVLAHSDLPTSEPSLYLLLRRIKSTYPSTPVAWLAWFHSQPALSPFASPRTYSFLLHRAFAESNLALVRALLEEIAQREMAWDEPLCRVLLRGYQRTGDERKVQDVLAVMGSRGWAAPRPSQRPDLGEKGKGKVKSEEDPVWKGWAMSVQERKTKEEADARRKEVDQAAGTPSVSPNRFRSRRRPPSATGQIASPARPPVLIPPNAASLPSSDITTLVELLVQDRRTTDAFSLADAWLSANRPVPPSRSSASPGRSVPANRLFRILSSLKSPTPSTSTTSTSTTSTSTTSNPAPRTYRALSASYHSSAVVLLNILLKPLFYERSPPAALRTFITSFLSRHSAPPPARPLTPNLATLRTLVSGVLGSRHAWRQAVKLTDWFGYTWGMPLGGTGFEHAPARLTFVWPPDADERERLGLVGPPPPPPSTARREREAQATNRPLPLQVKPHEVVPADVALLLLRHALDCHKRKSLKAHEVDAVRAWWDGFDHASSELLVGAHKGRTLVSKAIKAGLLESKKGKKGERPTTREERKQQQQQQ